MREPDAGSSGNDWIVRSAGLPSLAAPRARQTDAIGDILAAKPRPLLTERQIGMLANLKNEVLGFLATARAEEGDSCCDPPPGHSFSPLSLLWGPTSLSGFRVGIRWLGQCSLHVRRSGPCARTNPCSRAFAPHRRALSMLESPDALSALIKQFCSALSSSAR